MTVDRGSADRRAALASTTHSINRIDLIFLSELKKLFVGSSAAILRHR
jgi:hypothetical protein